MLQIIWVREKEPSVMTNTTGTDLYSARNLVHVHQQVLLSEFRYIGARTPIFVNNTFPLFYILLF